MRLHEPSWWYDRTPSWHARILKPLSIAYAAISARRLNSKATYRSVLPVICIGNLTVGGTGKTPLSITIAEMIRELGRYPVFLTRGYGGRLSGPLALDAFSHTANDIGDEPLLLARTAQTIIARDRVAGAKFIENSCPSDSVIIMDDGLQNPALAKDVSLAVVDSRRLFGNALCLPSGPLRAPLASQFGRVTAAVLNSSGETTDTANAAATLAGVFDGPILRCKVTPQPAPKWLAGARVFAFTGIANPTRFFDLVAKLGAEIVDRRMFPDHHNFTASDAQSLLSEAQRTGARLVTTEKDYVRLHGLEGLHAELRERTLAVAISMAIAAQDRARLHNMLAEALAAKKPPNGHPAD